MVEAQLIIFIIRNFKVEVYIGPSAECKTCYHALLRSLPELHDSYLRKNKLLIPNLSATHLF